MRAPVAAEGLRALKRRIAAIEGARAELEEARPLPLEPSRSTVRSGRACARRPA